VLHKGFISVPPERLREVLGGNACIAVLHFVEQALKCEGNAAGRCVILSCRHVVYGLSNSMALVLHTKDSAVLSESNFCPKQIPSLYTRKSEELEPCGSKGDDTKFEEGNSCST
jgi:hypothetical protein